MIYQKILTVLFFIKLEEILSEKADGDPTWGDVYKYHEKNLSYCGNCVYKKMDYDYPNAAYAEKLWSLLGKRVLKKCKVPEITLIKDSKYKELGMLSHIILDNVKEDLIDMNTLMFYKYERQDLDKFKLIVGLNDLLECIRMQVNDEENYKEVEAQIVQTLLLDCVTNNADRHTNNWCLIRDKNTNQYTVGLFDHSSSFIDMMTEGIKGSATGGWTSSSIRISDSLSKMGIGDRGDVLLKYLLKKYPEISKEFYHTLNDEIEYFYKDIEEINGNIDRKRIKRNISYKQNYMKELLQEQEYQERGGMERDE